jgi:hypothetical protein
MFTQYGRFALDSHIVGKKKRTSMWPQWSPDFIRRYLVSSVAVTWQMVPAQAMKTDIGVHIINTVCCLCKIYRKRMPPKVVAVFDVPSGVWSWKRKLLTHSAIIAFIYFSHHAHW